MSISIIMAGGGTAGHTSPLLATAEQVAKLDPTARVSCIGTPKGLETRVIPEAGLGLELIKPVPLPRSITPELFSVPLRLAQAVAEAKAILRRATADVVVGFGGYVSLPAYLAALQLRIPVVLHEQNAMPGLANKIAARFAALVAVSFPATPLPKAVYLGLPMRAAIAWLDRASAQSAARLRFGLPEAGKVLLVSGGSQGARSLNTAAIGAREELLAAGISILHLLGSANFNDDAQLVHSSGAVYLPLGYLDRMQDAYAAADLMLGRSGAGTVMETAMVGLPTVFVPLPHGNGEQARNADFLLRAGAALLVADAELNAESLLGQVRGLFADPGRLETMSRKARELVPSDAA
ncbi:MAG: undecaprenyldiphospho-muramoylpentapeptide beta-N-acetylglucosaminyltransferase, partial [Propionibacteriaceae bacterium]|nr:undecaprenyldiphospho-muramoylpentapeptide beta-N-acetylglucosaminyltransferase [Propionibacteriaceae bacterium]